MHRQVVGQQAEVVVLVAADEEQGGGDVEVRPRSRGPPRDVARLVDLQPPLPPQSPEPHGVDGVPRVHRGPSKDPPGTRSEVPCKLEFAVLSYAIPISHIR